MQFYSVKKRDRVEVPTERIKKIVYDVRGGKRYALRGTDDDGTVLTRFVNKELFDATDAPMEE